MVDKSNQFRHNHYVPEWYQRRFLPPGVRKFHYLDLAPSVERRNGHIWKRKEKLHWGPNRCFAQHDLYTTQWGAITNTDIEKFFFGRFDREAPLAIDYFANLRPFQADGAMFQTFLSYMSVQKLRTPKGLAWLTAFSGSKSSNYTLQYLQRLQQIFCATWTDCVWQIADASQSPTKFLLTDHPVTVYNRDCFPGSLECTAPNDPDVRLAGTHTIFPLSLDKVLILTNLAWVRNPYQKAKKVHPNPKMMRHAIFNFQDIQFDRRLSEEEVCEINYILKRRALRYVAAAEENWLYPERHLRSGHWRKLGDGYLLMPDPRHVHMGGTTYIGYSGGGSEAFGPFGHRPWERAFEDEKRDRVEAEALEKFKAEWAAMQGPNYRGISYHFAGAKARTRDSDEYHQHYLDKDNLERAKPGVRARRRMLRRS
jgi:hypothetical protein